MKRIGYVGGVALLAAFFFCAGECFAQRPPRLPVEIGPTTPQAPYGICPVTEKPRTLYDFIDIFGWNPPSSGVKIPGIPSTPPKNRPPRYWTPTSEQWQRMKGDPTALQQPKGGVPSNAVASAAPTSNVAPPKNTLPPQSAAAPAHTAAPSKPAAVQPPKNSPPARSAAKLTPQDVGQIKGQLRAQQTKLLDEISSRVNNATDPNRRAALQKTIDTVNDHLNNGGVTPRDVGALVNGIKSALPTADQAPALDAAGQIAAIGQVNQWIDGNRGTNPGAAVASNTSGTTAPNNAANSGPNGRLSADGRPNNPAAGQPGLGMANAAGGAGPGAMGNVVGGAGPGAMGNVVGGAGPGAMGNVVGGAGGGQNVPIGLIPGLPAGFLIPVPFDDGGGAVLVGLGRPGNRILLGTGDPDQAAGLLVAPPEASPAADASAAPAEGDTVLSNAATGPIRYSVNSSNFSMQPQEEQTLPAGTTWIVEFDRANGRGSARYQLEPGYYEFRAAADGWELYQKEFTVTLDNVGGAAPFVFVAENQTQTLAAGQKLNLAGRYPPVVRFDNGADQVKERRLTSNEYRVALGADRTYDLFTADSVPLPTASPAPASSTALSASTAAGNSTAPAAMSGSANSPGSATAGTTTLPAGFQLFDVTAAVTQGPAASRIPPGFNFFTGVTTEP